MVAMLRSSSYFSSCSPAVCALWIPLVFYLGFSCSNRFRMIPKWQQKISHRESACVDLHLQASTTSAAENHELQVQYLFRFSFDSVKLPILLRQVNSCRSTSVFHCIPKRGFFKVLRFVGINDWNLDCQIFSDIFTKTSYVFKCVPRSKEKPVTPVVKWTSNKFILWHLVSLVHEYAMDVYSF